MKSGTRMMILARVVLTVLFFAVAPLVYEWFLYSPASIDVQALPIHFGLGSTGAVRAQGIAVVFALAMIAGAISVAALCFSARLDPHWASMLLGTSVLLLAEDYELSRVVTGDADGRDFATLALVAVYSLAGWGVSAWTLRRFRRRSDNGQSSRTGATMSR